MFMVSIYTATFIKRGTSFPIHVRIYQLFVESPNFCLFFRERSIRT